MAVYKRNNSEHYWFGFVWNGKRVQRSTKQGDKETAKLLEAAERTKLARQEAGIESSADAPLFEKAAESFLKAGRPDGAPRAANTNRGFEWCVEALKTHFAGKRLSEITVADIERFKTARIEQGRAHGTINRDLSCLRRMFSREGIRSPFGRDKVRLLDEEEARKKRRRILTIGEEDRYLKACSDVLKDVALLILRCGLRPSEAFRLQPGDIYLKEGFLSVGESKSTEGIREVYFTKEVRDILSRRMTECEAADGEYLFPLRTLKGHNWSQPMTTVKTAHRTALRVSKVKHFRLYDLRHCFATAQLAAGTDLLTLQELMGHAELETTSIYARVQRETKVRATENFEKHLAARQIAEAEKAARMVSQTVQ
jgi:integrase